MIQEDVRADRRRPLLFAKVTAGVVWALCCLFATYRGLLSAGDARVALIGTIVLTGVPVVFLAIRLATLLNAQERQTPVAFWPGDRSSTIANWGLVLMIIYLALVSLLAALELDQLFFNGQLGTLLGYFSE